MRWPSEFSVRNFGKPRRTDPSKVVKAPDLSVIPPITGYILHLLMPPQRLTSPSGSKERGFESHPHHDFFFLFFIDSMQSIFDFDFDLVSIMSKYGVT